MKEKEVSYFYNLIKGRIVENVTEELFTKLGFNINRTGVENQFPTITKFLEKYKDTAVVKKMRNMPDFLIEQEGRGIFFLEVKYRHNGKVDIEKHLLSYKEYPEIIFLIFSSKEIYSLHFQEVIDLSKNGNIIDLENLNKIFAIDPYFKFTKKEKQIINIFRNITVRFFENLDNVDDALKKIIPSS